MSMSDCLEEEDGVGSKEEKELPVTKDLAPRPLHSVSYLSPLSSLRGLSTQKYEKSASVNSV